MELKIVKSLGILNKVKNILNKEVLRILYFMMIQPYLTYCNIVWGEASQLVLNGLKCLQKRAVHLITHSQYRAPTSPIFKDICVLKIEDLHSLHLALFVYKVQNNLVPQSCLRHISFAVNPHQYLLRRENEFCIASFRTNVREKYIGVCGPKYWNSLPEFIKEPVYSIDAFKRRLVCFLNG